MNQASDFPQHAVAELVAKSVVHQFEVVEVQHDYLEGSVRAARARNLFFKTEVQAARVRQARQ